MVFLLPRAPYLASLPKPASSSLRRPLPAMSASPSAAAAPAAVAGAEAAAGPRKLPVLLFDVMDTLVRDPFYHHIPAFFRMSMKELLESKHPTAWSEFEKGLIDEEKNIGLLLLEMSSAFIITVLTPYIQSQISENIVRKH